MKKLGLNNDPISTTLHQGDFTVHIKGLPLSQMTRDIAAFIGNKISKFIEVELAEKGVYWGSVMRIRVSMDVTKDLLRVVKLKSGNETLTVKL